MHLAQELFECCFNDLEQYWWEMISQCKEISQVIIVTNAKHYKHFERWATAHGLPYGNVINNGCTSAATLPGACYDLHVSLTVRGLP